MAKPIPHDAEAERAVLATVMAFPEVVDAVASNLAEDDFFVPMHRWLFMAMVRIVDSGNPLTAMLIDLQLEIDGHGRGHLDKIVAISSATHSPAACRRFIERLREIGNARRLAAKLEEIAESQKDLYADPTAWVENARTAIEESAEVRRASKARTMKELIDAEVANWRAKAEGAGMGISYPFEFLNRRLLGIVPPEYIIVAARPSVGKSAIAVQLARHFGRSQWMGNPVHCRVDVFESTSARLAERALSQESRVEFQRIRRGRFQEGDNDLLGPALARLRATRMDVEDTACDEQVLVAKWRQWRHDIGVENPAMIIGDYLQIVEPSNVKLPREQQVTLVSRAARNASKRLNCGVIFLCQFNRDVEKRGARARPQLSDLRESGSIEQDAATVIAIHRPWAVAETDEERQARQRSGGRDGGENDRDPRYTESLVLKARDGEVGIDTMSFNGRFLTFEEIDTHHRRPEDDFTPDADR